MLISSGLGGFQLANFESPCNKILCFKKYELNLNIDNGNFNMPGKQLHALKTQNQYCALNKKITSFQGILK